MPMPPNYLKLNRRILLITRKRHIVNIRPVLDYPELANVNYKCAFCNDFHNVRINWNRLNAWIGWLNSEHNEPMIMTRPESSFGGFIKSNFKVAPDFSFGPVLTGEEADELITGVCQVCQDRYDEYDDSDLDTGD